jgi:hypothetical protein
MDTTNFASFEELKLVHPVGTLTGDYPNTQPQPTVWIVPRHSARSVSTGLQPMSVKQYISQELALEKDVEAVLLWRDGKLFHIWTVANNPDTETRKRIFEREKAVIDKVEDYDFDFNIIARRDRKLDLNLLVNEAGTEIVYSTL